MQTPYCVLHHNFLHMCNYGLFLYFWHAFTICICYHEITQYTAIPMKLFLNSLKLWCSEMPSILCCPLIHAEKHAGLCVCGGRPGDVAHHESAAESQTLLHPQAAGSHGDQLHTKWSRSFGVLQHAGACGWKGKWLHSHKPKHICRSFSSFLYVCTINVPCSNYRHKTPHITCEFVTGVMVFCVAL